MKQEADRIDTALSMQRNEKFNSLRRALDNDVNIESEDFAEKFAQNATTAMKQATELYPFDEKSEFFRKGVVFGPLTPSVAHLYTL